MKNMVAAAGMLAGLLPRSSAAGGKSAPGDGSSVLYRAVNGNPGTNLEKVLELMGGIGSLIGDRDVVVIKPNVQWWNQGAPNLLALKTLVGSIMERSGGFAGEVVVAENCHRGKTPWTAAGWSTPFVRNGDFPGGKNYNELGANLKKRYGQRYSTVHWLDVNSGGKRIYGPGQGDGYVYCDGTGQVPRLACGNDLSGKDFRSTIMTYPIFTTDRGTVVDLKNGIWQKGAYTGQPLRFINLAALNHHSTYCGFTSLVKNYLGVSDLSGGPDPNRGGRLTGDYYNFHSFPFNQWSAGPRVGMIGRAVGTYLRTIRKADLNIITAEWVGLADRTEPPVARTRMVLAGSDPVALDYHAAKHVLFPHSKLGLHDPGRKGSPARAYLEQCATETGGQLDESRVRVVSYDQASRRMQTGEELAVRGKISWGTEPKALLKYLKFRYRQQGA
ncbi:MAG: DUF362 domain-containing protein [Deltaproteobacteria bacterium]|nr:DUF362 domain-containing protein [Deltaproteobacteria bacterium]